MWGRSQVKGQHKTFWNFGSWAGLRSRWVSRWLRLRLRLRPSGIDSDSDSDSGIDSGLVWVNPRRQGHFGHFPRHTWGGGWANLGAVSPLIELELRGKNERVAGHGAKQLVYKLKVLGQSVTDEFRSKTQKCRKHVFGGKKRFTISFYQGHEISSTFGKKSFLSKEFMPHTGLILLKSWKNESFLMVQMLTITSDLGHVNLTLTLPFGKISKLTYPGQIDIS